VSATRAAARPRRIVVVSPHLDDGVLSLGAAIATWARGGAAIEVLTVLGCDPGSAAPAGGWDRRGGFATEGESARARRDEDRRACAAIGATPVWLPFGSSDYDRHGGEDAVRRTVSAVVDGADLVLLPGFPLSQPDHDWLVRTLVEGGLVARRLGFYAEQPYTRRVAEEPRLPAWVDDAVVGLSAFERLPAGPRGQLAKWRAIRRYGSQLPLLGMRRTLRRGPLSYAVSPEWVAWRAGQGD
jgi:LmbE family N-acetylglucosaminyl deacetylase